MFAVGLFVSFLAAMCWLGFFLMRYKSGRIAKTPLVPTGRAASERRRAAGEKDAISVEGTLSHEPLLTSPITGTPCVYYELDVVAKWKSGESERSHTITNERNSVGIGINDGSGAVAIDISKGGDFDGMKRFEQTRGAIIGGAKFGDQGYTLHPGARYGAVQVPDNAKFHVKEKTLPPLSHAYVCGRMSDDGTISSPKFASLIISGKGRDALLGATQKRMKWVAFAGAAFSVVGVGLTVLGLLFPSEAQEQEVVSVDPVHVAGLATAAVLPTEADGRFVDEVVDHIPVSLSGDVRLPKGTRTLALGSVGLKMDAPRKARVDRRWEAGLTNLRGVKPSVVLQQYTAAPGAGNTCPTLDEIKKRVEDADIHTSERIKVAWEGEGPAYGDEIDFLLFERGEGAGFYVRKRFDHGDDSTYFCAAFGSTMTGFELAEVGSWQQAREMAASLLTTREEY